MKRRVFIAIDLDSKLKNQIASLVRQWHWLPIRWIPPENWHLTLIPPAYFVDEEIGALLQFLAKRRWGKSFPIKFSHISFAPPGKAARMVWLEGDAPDRKSVV